MKSLGLKWIKPLRNCTAINAKKLRITPLIYFSFADRVSHGDVSDGTKVIQCFMSLRSNLVLVVSRKTFTISAKTFLWGIRKNNPLSGLYKVHLLRYNRMADLAKTRFNLQAVSILKEPRLTFAKFFAHVFDLIWDLSVIANVIDIFVSDLLMGAKLYSIRSDYCERVNRTKLETSWLSNSKSWLLDLLNSKGLTHGLKLFLRTLMHKCRSLKWWMPSLVSVKFFLHVSRTPQPEINTEKQITSITFDINLLLLLFTLWLDTFERWGSSSLDPSLWGHGHSAP